jgi:hypothetical protein
MPEQVPNFPDTDGMFVGGPAPKETPAAPIPATLQEKRGKIFATKVKEEKVTMDEWGFDVIIKGLTGGQRAKFLQLTAGQQGVTAVPMDKVYTELVIMCTYDPDTGMPMFKTSDKDAILAQPGHILDKIVMKAMELSGLTNESVANLRKN